MKKMRAALAWVSSIVAGIVLGYLFDGFLTSMQERKKRHR